MTNTTTRYDPHEHAERLGLRVEYQNLRTDLGLYVGQSQLILLRPRMRVATERSVLAHEIFHHLHHDRRVNGLWSLRQERKADAAAATSLITPEQWRDVTAWSRDPREWAIELGVTGDVVLTYSRLARAS